LVAILFFVGIKMLLHDVWKPEEWMSLAVIFLSLATGIGVSWMKAKDVTPVAPVEEEILD